MPSEEGFIRADPALTAAGWKRRFLADPVRAKEAIDLYASLGYEVRAERVRRENMDEPCGACPAMLGREYVLIYTRRRDTPSGDAEDPPREEGERREPR